MGAAAQRKRNEQHEIIQMSKAELLALLAEAKGVSPWYTTHEAADYCKMTRSGFQKHVERGHVQPDSRATRGGTKLHRFRRETLDQFLVRLGTESAEEE